MTGWEDVADAWIRHVCLGDDEPWTWNEPALLEIVPSPGRLTIDAGCGEGRLSRALRARGHRVVAFDASATLVAAAREADPSGEYSVADVSALPVKDDAADLVVSINVLQHISDLDGALAEAARVLATGGRLLVCVVHPLSTAGRFGDDDQFVVADYLGMHELGLPIGVGSVVHHHRPIEGYVEALSRVGFVVERLREIPVRRRGGRVPLYLHLLAERRESVPGT